MSRASRFAAVATLALGSWVALGAQAFELRGFRGMHWGEGAEALRDAGPAQVDGDVACYQRERENLIFGDTELSGVHYCFHNDRLVMVMLEAPVAREAFSAEFQRTYGRPAKHNAHADVWGGVPSTTHAELVSQGPQGARLTITVSRIEADAARRMVQLASRPAAPDAAPATAAVARMPLAY
ncbi:hypothetical protein [Piscinibacter sp. HJYY11]|uniref:hypothetical protein n=1 Tax=Piscinibacter sp. HJYY11 TaxID=2801333 RepID=UPI00191F9307|nr:hypothetical protein [Piscinibacter sp. HJYY11]MBL0728815.1 hypothetical protein [Piscinibacter sp. HJYY11]